MDSKKDAGHDFGSSDCSSSKSPQDMANELQKSGWLQKRSAYGFLQLDKCFVAQSKHIDL